MSTNVKFFDIQKWNVQPWYNTGGTRDKKYVQSPEGEFYYFKTSIVKPGKDFKYEFWGEIIASEIGLLLGFDILPYNIAYDGIKVGCISKSMFTPGEEELVEGGKYLQAFENTFDPGNKALRNMYTFQLIESTLKFFGYEKQIKNIIEILVFDSLIGNSDRHQENWAFITKLSILSNTIKVIEDLVKKREFDKFPGFFKNLIKKKLLNKDASDLNSEGKKMILYFNKDARFAPIYDSGSSLGRELTEQKISSMLTNIKEIEAYVNRGEPEIRWENEKPKFFNMLDKVKGSQYSSYLNESLLRIRERYDEQKTTEIVNNIDNALPSFLNSDKLPSQRKELITKLITLRVEKLMHILD